MPKTTQIKYQQMFGNFWSNVRSVTVSEDVPTETLGAIIEGAKRVDNTQLNTH